MVQKDLRVIFLSNYFNHHQQFLSDEIYKNMGFSYAFVETESMSEERKCMGWRVNKYPEYVISSEEFKYNQEKYRKIIDDAEIVIIGSAPDQLVANRKRKNKLTIRYAERFYKKGCPKWQIPLRYVKNHIRYGKNEYMLCASAYTAKDAAITRNFIGKTYKWGYFTEVIEYDIEDLMEQKRKNGIPFILWAARFIEWKHPDTPIRVAKKLKNAGYKFKLQLIGNGELETKLKMLVQELEIEDCVELLGSMTPEKVRNYMERSNIFLFTSDYNEGWGAVLNESMNSGCAVVASHAIGSVPFLLKNEKNGLIYRNGDIENLYEKVKYLLDNPNYCEDLGREAYSTMKELWNPKVAAERLIKLVDELKESGQCDVFKTGPCSKADYLENDWFK